MPTTRSGCRHTVAIFVIGMPDVFDARIASEATASSICGKTSCLISSFSGTASSTRSAPASAAPRSVSNRSAPPSSLTASSRSRTPAASWVAAFARSSASELTS